MADFVVNGIQPYGEPVLQADTLWFKSQSKLVISPWERSPNSPSNLTIMVKSIRIDDTAEITYDLDGRPGLDPNTPAPDQSGSGITGSGGFSPPGEGSVSSCLKWR